MRWIASLVCLTLLCGMPAIVFAASTTPKVSADAAILMDWRTGVILFEKEAFTLRHPASLTKMLTAIVAVECSNLQDIVTITPDVRKVTGSKMGFKPGQRFTMEDMLHMLLLESANDAAVAIAVHVSGGVEAFADEMNRKAKEIGALSTRFTNPHGLTHTEHLTTAYDLALLARYALNIPFIEQTVATKEAEVDRLDTLGVIRLKNTNRLLWGFEGGDGVKTGTTFAAGNSLAASATRDGHRLIAVVLHSADRYRDSGELLDYGFDGFCLVNPHDKGSLVRTVRVKNGLENRVTLVAAESLVFPVPREYADRTHITGAPADIAAPCERFKPCAELSIKIGDTTVAKTGLYPRDTVLRTSPFKRFQRRVLSPIFDWLSIRHH